MLSEPSKPHQRWLLLALTLCTFFGMLGSRSLNEPDEGRYAEIAREMVETGDWLVPHIWYVPHLDKPPLTYWMVAASLTIFGQNEWAVRLPLALAGLNGLWAVFLFARSVGNARTAFWAVLVLQSSLLYFVMARMLTTDIILTQFIAWAFYFGWRSWRRLDDFESPDATQRARAARACFGWQLAAWTALGLGFLGKGPIALIVPLLTWAICLLVWRPKAGRWQTFVLGNVAGLIVFNLIVLPWFIAIFQTVPGSFDYMFRGQLVGHALGTTIKNRGGSPFYYFAILAVGWLPWTVLLGWLWRRTHWRQLNPRQNEAWLLFSAWAGLTFIIFTFSRAKLPAYILPLFPALALLTALRWFVDQPSLNSVTPGWLWRAVMLSPLLLAAAIPLAVRFAFKVTDASWQMPQLLLAILVLIALAILSGKWRPTTCQRVAVFLTLTDFALMAWFLPTIEITLKSNQTLKPIGLALQREMKPEDVLLCWERFPQGLPFYAFPMISSQRQPYLGGMPLQQIPFEFPGNRERFGDKVVADVKALDQLLTGRKRVFVVGFKGAFQAAQTRLPSVPFRLLLKCGQWELFANR